MSETDGIIEGERDNVLLTAQDAYKEISDFYVTERDNAPRLLEMQVRLNEQSISFCEKFILLDGGTIALSLAFIGSVISKAGHVPTKPFLWLVCPAWCLLLVSILSSWMSMSTIHGINLSSFSNRLAHIEQMSHLQLGLLLTRLSNAVKNAITEPVTNVELQAAQKQMADALAQVEKSKVSWEKQKAETARQAIEHNNRLKRYGIVSFCMTMAGVVLLCLFAVAIVLSL